MLEDTIRQYAQERIELEIATQLPIETVVLLPPVALAAMDVIAAARGLLDISEALHSVSVEADECRPNCPGCRLNDALARWDATGKEGT